MEPCAKWNKIPPKGYTFFLLIFVCVCLCCACADGSLVTRDSLPAQSTTLEALLRGEGLDKRNSSKNDEESLLEIQVCLRSARSASPTWVTWVGKLSRVRPSARKSKRSAVEHTSDVRRSSRTWILHACSGTQNEHIDSCCLWMSWTFSLLVPAKMDWLID